jgi:hypothetical protein
MKLQNIWMNSDKHIIGYALELLPVLFLTSFMTAPYLNFRPLFYPMGYEFHVSSVSHYIWRMLPQCGDCVLWFGQVNGGMPAFGELLGASLHPLVIITTLIWGVINGTKVLLFLCLLMSGSALWWFAKELEVSRLSRIWVSLFGVVGGYVIGRLESGNIILVLSTVSACFVYPMVLRLHKKTTYRRIAVLAVIMALTWLSGQGYNQLGVVVGWFPAFVWLLYENGKKKQQKWIAFGSAIILSALICAILFLPAAHFMSSMEKYTMDDFKNLQPMRYVPLNLVISDNDFYHQQYLGNDTFPYAHLIYIGWFPVILAILSGYFVMKRENKRVYAAIYASILLVLIATSRDIYPVLKDYLPIVNRLRAFSVATSMFVPQILVMAAWTLDRLFELKWPKITFNEDDGVAPKRSFNLKWIVLIPLMILPFKSLIPFAQDYIHVIKVDVPQSDLAFARLNDTQWVNPPSDEWFPVLMNENRKLIMTDRFFVWKDRERLFGYIDLTPNPNNDPIEGRISSEENFDIVMRPEEIYASANMKGTIKPCQAKSLGGQIDVWCDTPESGILTVHDYLYSGWFAWVDGKRAALLQGDWLSVNLPAGKHVISFRFYPWDVYVGAGISLIGILLTAWMFFSKEPIEENAG